MERIRADQLGEFIPEEIEWLVPKWLIGGQLNLLAGEVASGKTFLALDLALGVAARGETWGGMKVPLGKVLYLCLDTSASTMGHRLISLCKGYGIAAPQALYFDFSSHNFADENDVRQMVAMVEAEDQRLVIIDTLARYMPGSDENNVFSIGKIFSQMQMLCRNGRTTVLLVHQLNKRSDSKMGEIPNAARRIRGSTGIFASAETALMLRRQGQKRVLTAVKNRLSNEARPLRFMIVENDLGVELDFDPPEDTRMTGSPSEQLIGCFIEALEAEAYFWSSREELTSSAAEKMVLPSKRTIDAAFARLAEVDGIDTRMDGHSKYYMYVPPDVS